MELIGFELVAMHTESNLTFESKNRPVDCFGLFVIAKSLFFFFQLIVTSGGPLVPEHITQLRLSSIRKTCFIFFQTQFCLIREKNFDC